jgi:hypothetical protein
MTENIFGKGITLPRLQKAKIRFHFKGRTTNVKVIFVDPDLGETVYKGWSRRSLEDRDNRTIGRREALAKALRDIDPILRTMIWDAVFKQSSKMARLRIR